MGFIEDLHNETIKKVLLFMSTNKEMPIWIINKFNKVLNNVTFIHLIKGIQPAEKLCYKQSHFRVRIFLKFHVKFHTIIKMFPSRLLCRDHFSFCLVFVFSFSRWCSQLMMLVIGITRLLLSSVPSLTQPQQQLVSQWNRS